MHDVIVVGMGPGGSAAASMLRAPNRFHGVVGSQALDVLAIDSRAAVPTRDRVVNVTGHDANFAIQDGYRMLGVPPGDWHLGTTTIAGVEALQRRVADFVGVEAVYGAAVERVDDLGFAGVHVRLADGSVERARFVVDGSGGRIGAFDRGEVTGTSVYLSGQLPMSAADDWLHGTHHVPRYTERVRTACGRCCSGSATLGPGSRRTSSIRHYLSMATIAGWRSDCCARTSMMRGSRREGSAMRVSW